MLWSLFYYKVRREAFLFSYPLIKWTKNTSIALIAQLRSYTHSGKGSHKTNWLVLCVMSKAWQVYGIWQSSKKWNKQQTGMWITLQICLLYISGFFFFFLISQILIKNELPGNLDCYLRSWEITLHALGCWTQQIVFAFFFFYSSELWFVCLVNNSC